MKFQLSKEKKKLWGKLPKKTPETRCCFNPLSFFLFRTSRAYHLNILLEQLLKDAGLSVDWKDTILPLVMRISEQVTKRKGSEQLISPYIIAPESRI